MRIKIRKSFTPNPVCIDGPSRSGKGAVSVAVSSLDRTEHITTILNIDRMIIFYSLGLIDREFDSKIDISPHCSRSCFSWYF